MPTEHPGIPPDEPERHDTPPAQGGHESSGVAATSAGGTEPTAPLHRPGTEPTEATHRPELPAAQPNPAIPLPGLPDPLADLGAAGLTDLPAASESGSGATDSETPLLDSGTSRMGSGPPRRTRGSVRRQQAGVTQPREPTLGEARAREKARERAEEAERAAQEALEAKRRNRKRMLVGGVAIVGVAAVVGAGYLAYEAINRPHQVTAYCVTDDSGQQTVVSDDDCVRAQDYATTYGGGYYGSPGIFLYSGHQYRYYYGGSNTGIGSHPSGGSFSAPSHSVTSTKSGTVVRGGLGVKGGGKSGGS
jgi:hypothetical protein